MAETYNILRGIQLSLTFDPITDGNIEVSGEGGVYVGFKTLDEGGSTIGGGLIGAWVYSGNGTVYRLTLIGTDSTVVQLRFDRLKDHFTCPS